MTRSATSTIIARSTVVQRGCWAQQNPQRSEKPTQPRAQALRLQQEASAKRQSQG